MTTVQPSVTDVELHWIRAIDRAWGTSGPEVSAMDWRRKEGQHGEVDGGDRRKWRWRRDRFAVGVGEAGELQWVKESENSRKEQRGILQIGRK